MDKDKAEAILESKGVIGVTYENHPVWLEGIGNRDDGMILVKNIATNELFEVNVEDLKESY